MLTYNNLLKVQNQNLIVYYPYLFKEFILDNSLILWIKLHLNWLLLSQSKPIEILTTSIHHEQNNGIKFLILRPITINLHFNLSLCIKWYLKWIIKYNLEDSIGITIIHWSICLHWHKNDWSVCLLL